MSGYHVITEAEHDCDDLLAKRSAEYLVDAYPGHPWHIAIKGGVLIIKHMNISNSHGAVLHYKVVHDENTLKKGIVFAGGELLERAGLKRGRLIEGEVIRHVEGIPDKNLVVH